MKKAFVGMVGAFVFACACALQSCAQTTLDPVLEDIRKFDFPMWVVVLAVAVILLLGSSLAKKGEWQEDPLSLESTKAIRGFCAVGIILHHLSQNLVEMMPELGALAIFKDIGVVFVGIFFFLSGYGLFKSFKTKDNYLKGFFRRRMSAILVPFYVCILVFIALQPRGFRVTNLIANLTGWHLINSHMWYIVEIAVLYIVFFFIFRFIKKQGAAIAVMGVVTAAITIGSLLLGHGGILFRDHWFMGEWWYNTTMLFFAGILFSKFEGAFMRFAKKFYVWLLPASVIISVVFMYLTDYALKTYSYWTDVPGYMGYSDKFICLAFQLPMVLFTTLTFVLIMMKVKFGNPILKFLGTISLELYLIHNLFLTGLIDGGIDVVQGGGIYIILTFALSIGAAAVINGVDKYIIALIQGKKSARSVSDGHIHSIDCLRFIMACLVVCIHIPFSGQGGLVVISYAKTAVPFFLVVCGYFLFRKDNAEFMKRLKKQAARIAVLTVVANILYLAATAAIMYIKSGTFDGFSDYFTLDALKNFLLYNMSPFGDHLWYLGSLLYALLILMVLCATRIHKYVMFAAPVLLGVYIFLSWTGDAEYFVYRNALFVTLPYLMMGCLIRRYEDKLMKIKAPILWVAAAILCATTIVELNSYGRGAGVPFFSAELLVYVIVLLTLKHRTFGAGTLLEKLGAKCSLFIYIVHVIPIMILTTFLNSWPGFVRDYGPITVFVFTALLAALFKVRSLRAKPREQASAAIEQKSEKSAV